MKKKLILSLLVMCLGVLLLGIVTASAATATYGNYTYKVSKGEVKITDFKTSVSGAITIPSEINGYPVTSIGEEAFSDCTGLTSVEIPDSVTSIGNYAFSNCTGLTRVDITDIEAWCNISFSAYISNPLYYAENLYLNGKLVTNLTIPDGVTSIGNHAFYNCTGLTSVEIPDSVTSIGEWAFSECTGLTSVEIPDSVTSIDRYAFENCIGLTSVEIPDSVTSLGAGAFAFCTGLTSVEIPDSVTSIGTSTFGSCTGLTSVEIPDSVTSIGDSAFASCTGLTSVEIPDSVTSIGGWAFAFCTGLTSVEIPDSVTSIGISAFGNCTGLTSVEIPDSVKSIGKNTFLNCTGLTSVEIADGVTSIGEEAFENCTGLISVEIPDSVTSLGGGAFAYCTGLTSVTIGDGVTSISDYAFSNCTGLTSVEIPDSVTRIGSYAFEKCSKIEAVFYEGSEEQWNNILVYTENRNLTNAKIVYKAKKRTYKFETNCEAVLSDVNDYALLISPVVKNGEKILAGWYDNAELSGEPISFPYYGDAEILYAAWTDRTGLTFDDAFIAKENKQYTVKATRLGQIIYYEFVPKYSGEYRFYSTGSLDTYGYLYNGSRSQLTYNDNGGEGYNFYIAENLTAGEIYYIGATVYIGTGTFTLVIETDCVPGTKTVCVTVSDGEKIFTSIPSYLPEDSRIILACYDGERFVTAKSELNKNETIYFVIDKEFDSAKVMVWEDFNTLVPITEVENVEL